MPGGEERKSPTFLNSFKVEILGVRGGERVRVRGLESVWFYIFLRVMHLYSTGGSEDKEADHLLSIERALSKKSMCVSS